MTLGAAIHSRRLPSEPLAFSAQAGVQSMNEFYPLERAAAAYDRMLSGEARFRVVLTM
jgi:D-arabinose 1-dehydrogenase-like Zn-dependent alcohol dehydrogenase